MKRQRNLLKVIALSITCSISAQAAPTESFMHSGQLFQATRLGKILRVAPAEITSKLERQSAAEIDCEGLERSVNRLETQRQICLENPNSSACRTLSVRFRVLAEGRANELTNVDHRMIHAWKITAPMAANPLPSDLVKTSAQRFRVEETFVEVEDFSQSNFNGVLASTPNVNFSEDAITPRIESVVQLAPNIWARNGAAELSTQNLAIACDLTQGKASFEARGEIVSSRVESVPAAQIEALWNSYKYLSRNAPDAASEQNTIMQGIMIGFHISRSVPSEIPLEGFFHPADIFARMYQQHNGAPLIKSFNSSQAMRNALYPDTVFRGVFQPIWRLQ